VSTPAGPLGPTGPSAAPTPIDRGDADSNVIFTEPMPRHRRTVLRVFREELALLKVDCISLKRRRRSTPYLFTFGWSCLTGAAACIVGIVIYDNTNPRPGHHVWVMYAVCAIALAVLGIALLIFHMTKRRLDDQDVDDLMTKIDRIDYGAEVEKE
jgi:hypothetical protein